MGSDSRDCDGCGIDQEAGGGSDTTILFHLSADRQSAYGVSIPRDSLVDRPDCKSPDGDTIPGGTDVMWNAAYSYGGPACTIQQFEQTTGVRIDNYVVVDFGSFQDMVDAMDGVEVCVPEDIDSPEYGITIPAGTRTLNGKEALAYVRVRHGVGDGSDIGRIKRQQAFIAALTEKVISGGTLTRFDRLVRFLNAATDSLTTDIPNIKEMAKVGLPVQEHRPQADPVHHRAVRLQHRAARAGSSGPRTPTTLWKRIPNDQPLGKLRVGSIGADQAPTGTRGSDVLGHEQPADARQRVVEHRLAVGRRVLDDRVAVGDGRRRVPTSRRDGHRRELGRPRLRRPLLVTEPSDASEQPSRTGSASAGWPRCSATSSPTPPPTSGTRPSGRIQPADRGDAWLKEQVPPHHGVAGSRAQALGGCCAARLARRAGRGSPGAA